MTHLPDVPRWYHLDDEVTGVRVLLGLVDEVLARARSLDYDRHAIDALLAPAIERLCKLTYGLGTESVDQRWPSEQIVGYGHKITKLHHDCVHLIEARLGEATNESLVIDARDDLDANPYGSLLFAHLENYAAGARYFSLDSLGVKGPERETLREFWAKVDTLSFENSPKPLPQDGAELDAVLRSQRSDDLREVVAAITMFYYQAWAQGVCGPLARRWSSLLETKHAP